MSGRPWNQFDQQQANEHNAGMKTYLKKRVAKISKMSGKQFDRLTSRASYSLNEKRSSTTPSKSKKYVLTVNGTAAADAYGDRGKAILQDHIKQCVALAGKKGGRMKESTSRLRRREYLGELRSTGKYSAIASMTSRNDHSGALVAAAKELGFKALVKKFELISQLQRLEGHMPGGLLEYRNGLYKAMLEAAKKKLSAADYREFHGSL